MLSITIPQATESLKHTQGPASPRPNLVRGMEGWRGHYPNTFVGGKWEKGASCARLPAERVAGDHSI